MSSHRFSVIVIWQNGLDTVSDKTYTEQARREASLAAPDWFIFQDLGLQTEKPTEQKNIRMDWNLCQTYTGKSKPHYVSEQCFSETLDSCSGEFWLDLRVCSWRKLLWKNSVDTVQRDRNFSGPTSKQSNCWLSFAIKWDFFFQLSQSLSGLLENLWLLTNPLSLAANINFPSLIQALQNNTPIILSLPCSLSLKSQLYEVTIRERRHLWQGFPKSLWPVTYLQGDHATQLPSQNLTVVYFLCFCTKCVWFHYFKQQLPHRILFLSSTTRRKLFPKTFPKPLWCQHGHTVICV